MQMKSCEAAQVTNLCHQYYRLTFDRKMIFSESILGFYPVLAVGLLDIAVGAAIFLFVFTFVSSIFGQRGKAEITPEREIALAAGVSDRNTVFEMPMLQPLMWLMLVMVRQLPLSGIKEKIRRTLIAAGSPNFYTSDEYLAVVMLWGLIIAFVLEVAHVIFLDGISVVLVLVGFLAGVGGMIYHLHDKAAKRIRMIGRRLPYTLDLIALAMGAGATFTEAVRTVVGEDPDHPFNVEFQTVLAEIELGTTRRQALMNMSDRIPLEALRSIVASIIQAEALGTPLSNVLKQQAGLMRLQRSVRAEKLAASASVRILLPSLLILFSVILAVFGTIIIRGLKGDLF